MASLWVILTEMDLDFVYFLPMLRVLHSSPKDVHNNFIQFSQGPQVTDPDPGHIEFLNLPIKECT